MTDRTAGLSEEIAYWDEELALRGVHAEYVRRRLDPERRREEYPTWIEGLVKARSQATKRGTLRAIDLGSGPLTTLAWGHEHGQLQVLALDPLADEYGELIARHKIIYPVIPKRGHGEILAEIAGRGAADLIYSRNALDHAEDVQRCFEQVASALKPGGIFALEVFAYEGRRESYSGLHQFDFRCEAGELRCATRHGESALDVARTGLFPVFLTPPRTLRIPEAGDPPEGIFAAFQKDGNQASASALRAGARNAQLLEFWRSVLSPGGALGQYWQGSWQAEQVRYLFPQWIEPLVEKHLLPRLKGPARVLDLACGPVPSLLWAQMDGYASVTAADPIAGQLVRLMEELGIQPPPVQWIESEPEALVQAIDQESIDQESIDQKSNGARVQSGSKPRFDLVFTRHSLHKAENLQAIFEGVAALLEPDGLFLIEAVADEGEHARWSFPVRFSLFARDGKLGARNGLGQSVLDVAAAGFDVVSIASSLTEDERKLLHVCLRRRK